MKIHLRRKELLQFMRFLMVGVMNTMVTFIVIYVCTKVWHVNMWVSNAIGYVAGLINSFVWNKLWVFQTHTDASHAMAETIKFGVGFLLCYGLQLLVTWFLTTPMDLIHWTWNCGGLTFSGYALATFIGMGVYTVANFIFNRLVTFKSTPEE